MPKKLFQDIIKIKSPRTKLIEKLESRIEPKIEPKIKEVKRKGGGGRKYTLWFVALVSTTFFLFALSFLFSKAVITVNSKVKDVVLNENLSASKIEKDSTLSFDLVVISGDEAKDLKAQAEKDVSIKAEGIVVIYNAFSSASQMLSIDTRLEGSNGKIYKTQIKTIVPGIKKDGTPGSVEVGIYGEEAGAEYNSVPLDFKILGFKGTPKYPKIYARSKGKITGGLKGKVSEVVPADKITATSELKTALKAKLLKKATDQIPSGFILFKDAIFFEGDEGALGVMSKDNMVPFTMKGTLYGFLFDETKLTKKIVEKVVPDYDGSDVYILNIRDLKFILSNVPTTVGIPTEVGTKDINFNLSGTSKIVWKFDQEKFMGEVLGKSKGSFNTLLAQYKNIDSATAVISPFWRRSFPDKSKKIEIIVNYPK